MGLKVYSYISVLLSNFVFQNRKDPLTPFIQVESTV